MHSVFWLLVSEPALQVLHELAPLLEYSAPVQSLQPVLPVPEAYCPAAQLLQALAVPLDEDCPAVHAMQFEFWALVSEPALHEMHELALALEY